MVILICIKNSLHSHSSSPFLILFRLQSEDPCDSHIAIHGKTGVSFIAQHDGFLYSAGRDGTYRKYSVTEGWKLRLIHTFKVRLANFLGVTAL